MQNILTNIQLIIGIFIGIFIGYLINKVAFQAKIRKERKKSIKKSKEVILGQVNEKVAPLLPDFKYNMKDLTFLGKGIDYIVFDGLSVGDLKQIVLLEIKSGKSNLNKNERMIKTKIKEGKIKYEILRIN